MALLRGREGHARIVIFTIIRAEFAAAKKAFGATEEVGVTGAFTAPEFVGSADRVYPFVVVQSPDRSNTPAAGGVRQVLERWRPEIVLVVGIGGGIQRPTSQTNRSLTGPGVGDVVVGKYVHYAPYTKNLPKGRYLRYIPIDQPAAMLLGQHVSTLAAQPADHCFRRLAEPRPGGDSGRPKVHVGELVAIESIAGNPRGEDQIAMLQTFDNADVVDMESMGVGRALHEAREDTHYSPRWVSVRGISDIVTADSPPLPGEGPDGVDRPGVLADDEDNNAQRAEWKRYAAASAATFARELAERLLTADRPPSEADPGASRWCPSPDEPERTGVVGGLVQTAESGSHD